MTVSLTLHAPAGPQPVGRPVAVWAELRNEGTNELLIVDVVDGSETGVRFPRWLPSVWLGDAAVATTPRPEDPLVGPLRMEDFRRLAPGEAFNPGQLATFSTFAPPAPGRYTYRLELSTESDTDEGWLGSFNQDREVIDLVARVPRFTARATVTVEVR